MLEFERKKELLELVYNTISPNEYEMVYQACKQSKIFEYCYDVLTNEVGYIVYNKAWDTYDFCKKKFVDTCKKHKWNKLSSEAEVVKILSEMFAECKV